MIEAAESQGKRIGVQGRRYEGYMVWINALIASGGGQIIENAELGADADADVASPAGDMAAEIVGTLARSSAAPADMSTAGEEEARSVFQSDDGSFMVNWPYVYNAAKESVAAGAIDQSVVDDIGWARYPAGGGGDAERTAARRHQPGHRELHQAPRRGAGGGQVHHVAGEQHPVHDRVREPGGPGGRVRRPGGARGVPDGRPDPRLDQRAPGRGRSRRTTATCRPRCSARGTRRRA